MDTKIPKSIKKRLFLPQLNIPGAFPHSPTISPEETKLVAELLEKDANEHHIFFNREKGFHNHLTHMLLADYSLGASTKRLKEVYEQEAEKQQPKLPKHQDFEWTEHLGDEDYYSDYLDFMIGDVGKLGRVGAVEKYAFDEQHNMQSRLMGGAYHSFIHTGYGLEFGIDGMVAEGLAQMCVHSDRSKVYFPKEVKTSKSASYETALDIAKSTFQDKRFDDLVKFEDEGKYFVFLGKKPELVLEYVDRWPLSIDRDELMEKVRELIILGVAVYAGPQRPNKEVVLDFFLMHALTSSLFLPIFIQQINPKFGMRLLKGKLAVDLAYFISRGRPALHLEQFSSTTEFVKSWSEIIELAVNHSDMHVPKVIRALKQAERWDPEETLGRGVYRAIASMTVENIIDYPGGEQDDWSREGIGFDELWDKVPNRKKQTVADLS